MKLTQHVTNNSLLRAPRGMTQDECTDAPITRIYYEHQDLQAVRTYWLPTPEELAVLNAGGVVQVQVLGDTMPPMYVTTKGRDDPVNLP